MFAHSHIVFFKQISILRIIAYTIGWLLKYHILQYLEKQTELDPAVRSERLGAAGFLACLQHIVQCFCLVPTSSSSEPRRKSASDCSEGFNPPKLCSLPQSRAVLQSFPTHGWTADCTSTFRRIKPNLITDTMKGKDQGGGGAGSFYSALERRDSTHSLSVLITETLAPYF